MLGKKKAVPNFIAEPSAERVTSVIGPGITWTGDLRGKGGIRIEGTVDGEIAHRFPAAAQLEADFIHGIFCSFFEPGTIPGIYDERNKPPRKRPCRARGAIRAGRSGRTTGIEAAK